MPSGNTGDFVLKSFFHTLGTSEIFARMTETSYTRKLDSVGRIMIPIRLREQMGLQLGNEYRFAWTEENGRSYICIDCGPSKAAIRLEEAKDILRRHGMEIPDDLE
jgi:bifunctional DNA-binding transcriptional regulator/antitoxin component of YhaV-PrlF toxin-antitoxin module